MRTRDTDGSAIAFHTAPGQLLATGGVDGVVKVLEVPSKPGRGEEKADARSLLRTYREHTSVRKERKNENALKGWYWGTAADFMRCLRARSPSRPPALFGFRPPAPALSGFRPIRLSPYPDT